MNNVYLSFREVGPLGPGGEPGKEGTRMLIKTTKIPTRSVVLKYGRSPTTF